MNISGNLWKSSKKEYYDLSLRLFIKSEEILL